ncbi:MAG TPA: DinB family protein, partial [Alphaproteobacteria bacterium]|nr:DinB family protein [Alphaproteobacteria bacterium]
MSTLQEQIKDVRQRAEWVIQGLAQEKLTQRPSPASWSIAECIGHLNLVSDDYHPLISAAIKKARQENLKGQGPFNPGMMGRFMIKSMEPPPRRRFKAVPRLANPVPVGDASTLLSGFLARQDEFERLI